eukprot:6302925-Amphidinium_carterae.2
MGFQALDRSQSLVMLDSDIVSLALQPLRGLALSVLFALVTCDLCSMALYALQFWLREGS